MKRQLSRLWTETDGVLSFEWVLLLTLLTIGIVSGLAGARDAIIDELGDVAEAAQAFNQSYSVSMVSIDFDGDGTIDFTAAASAYTEGPEDNVYTDCASTAAPLGQPAAVDGDS